MQKTVKTIDILPSPPLLRQSLLLPKLEIYNISAKASPQKLSRPPPPQGFNSALDTHYTKTKEFLYIIELVWAYSIYKWLLLKVWEALIIDIKNNFQKFWISL